MLYDAPRVRIGVSFGRDRVIATPALVDTGSDLCVVPANLVPWPVTEGPTMAVLVETARGGQFPATAHFPTITVGDIRVPGVSTILLPEVEPILGRSFLNLCDVRISAKRRSLVLRRVERKAG